MFSERFDRALAFAHELHRKQKRKTSGSPYIAHPLAVAALVIEDGGTEDEAIAALLHDSIEDQARYFPGGTHALIGRIEELFGPDVLRLVHSLTEVPTPTNGQPGDRRSQWRSHKEAYFAHIRSSNASVRRISCADSLHNVRTIIADYRRMGDAVWERFRTKNAGDQLWAYQRAASAFGETGTGPLAEELGCAVDELARAIGAQ